MDCDTQVAAGSCLLLKLCNIRRCRGLGARSARKMIQWIIFSEGGPEGHGRYYLPGEEFEGLERPERLPVAGFQRKAGRKAPDRGGLERSPLPISVFVYLFNRVSVLETGSNYSERQN